ncbi:tripartite motif-containing protein [Pimephales promelas]|nr:tripartite motif-containing protein [Pimephales promelas]
MSSAGFVSEMWAIGKEPVAAGMLLSCVLSINRSLWNSCVKRATSWPAASVTCPPTKTTGLSKHMHKDADRTDGLFLTLVHVGKALQDQRWLLQNLMARVEEKRSTVESTAKQIQGRLHGIKITQRKAENQIKMAKMIMMNELNKRANLLIEQLESISSDFKQRLEDQLQGAIELCSQLEHVQNFFTWATAHHRRNPLLFSKELIALQMQQLLEPLMLSEAWTPLKIKFNWDASFWTKQMSTLGKLKRPITMQYADPIIDDIITFILLEWRTFQPQHSNGQF